jgi:hypothetical protein
MNTLELQKKMKHGGPYDGHLVTLCLRSESHVNGGRKRSDLCLRDSATYSAFEAQDSIWTRFEKTRAVQRKLEWIANLTHNTREQATILVDEHVGVYFFKEGDSYGMLADVKACMIKDPEDRPEIFIVRTKGSNEGFTESLGNIELSTESPTLIAGRIGQEKFRKELILLWSGQCSVTKFGEVSLLRASHIKPWKTCNDAERLNKYNGLLLVPNLDAAFDLGYISFTNSGSILINSEKTHNDWRTLGIHPEMRLVRVFKESIPFLSEHRKLHGFEKNI